MDHLWTPWRYRYVSTFAEAVGCLFCRVSAETDDRKNHILLRAKLNFVMLNRYPYSSGHLMIAPYAHVATLEESDPLALQEMMSLAQRAETVLRSVYRPDGLNLGMNVGRSAGAGIPGHLHLHVLPRWSGDTSFMTTVADTRVLPEDLETTYERLSAAFARAGS
jgi:ATP adenylyltransferase